MPTKPRCPWCGDDPQYIAYHDHEWGVPCRDDQHLFEMLILEGAQAGLSWQTILRKRERYRQVFDQFVPSKVAAYGPEDVQRLLADPGIVRNRLKVESAIRNARGVLAIQQEHGSLAAFLWSYVDGTPIQNAWRCLSEVPARTDLSDHLSKDLKKRGFNFVGSTICYAFMQAIGMVNDHLVACHRYEQVRALG
jgi:DNA-3-methyladenine glycosylase I